MLQKLYETDWIHLGKGWIKMDWRVTTLQNGIALQNGSGIFIYFIRSWMHWFDHFLTKSLKYLWIKTGDRHYHFVEPWVIDRPFCRMETVYRSHFVEKRAGSLQNTPPNLTHEMGRNCHNFCIFTKTSSVCANTNWVCISWTPCAEVENSLPF